MSYSTPVMVRQALVPSSDGSLPSPASHTAADLSDAQLTDAIGEADALIEGYIGGRYTVPVALDVNGNVPHPLDYWSRSIAAYLATCTYRGSLDFTDNDPVARRYAGVLLALTAVSTGKMNLQIPDNTGPESSTIAGPPINPYVGNLWGPWDFGINQTYDDNPSGNQPYWGAY